MRLVWHMRFWSTLFFLAVVGCGGAIERPPPIVKAQSLEAACDENSPVACYKLGLKYQQKDLVGTRRIRRSFQRSCALRHGDGCLELAKLSARGGSFTDGVGAKAVAKLYGKGCDYGSQEACRLQALSRFMQGRTLDVLKNATQSMLTLCTPARIQPCLDYIRGRYVLGMDPEVVAITSIGKHCESTDQTSDTRSKGCERLRPLHCQMTDSLACLKPTLRQRILDEPTCPESDEPWVVAAAYAALLDCKSNYAGTITLHFDALGKQSKRLTHRSLDTCALNRLRDIQLMPLASHGACSIKLQF